MTDPKQLGIDQSSGPSERDRIIVVYICPNCPNYFGSSSAGLLEEQWNIAGLGAANPGQPTHTRSRCPDCGQDRERRYARLIPKPEVAEAVKRLKAQGLHDPLVV